MNPVKNLLQKSPKRSPSEAFSRAGLRWSKLLEKNVQLNKNRQFVSLNGMMTSYWKGIIKVGTPPTDWNF